MRYLQLQSCVSWQKHVFSAAMLLTAVAALGTQSRGALLGLSAMATFLWWKSDKKFYWAAALIAIATALLSFMPETWWSRMDTIRTYEDDGSAMGRINAWWMAWNMAQHRFFGGGFDIYTLEQFMLYAPNPTDVHAAHSIYFQVLGEHGFIGLVLFLTIGVTAWLTAAKLIALARENSAHRWAGDLGAMTQVSMVGYATGGAFLSLSYWDIPYNYMVAAVIALHLVRTSISIPESNSVQGNARPNSDVNRQSRFR
jgi:probable O-glycosylation ligase (exosortase A-associated)